MKSSNNINMKMHHTLQIVPWRRHTDEFKHTKWLKDHIIKSLPRDVGQNQRNKLKSKRFTLTSGT